MPLQDAVELILALGTALLLARDVRRAWRDPLRRPITLLMATVMAALLIGVYGGQSHPSAWWLLVPGCALIWEAVRGWRRAPRCHLWEAGMGAFALCLLFAAAGLGLSDGKTAAILLIAAVASGVTAVFLLWRSHRREPRPSRTGDASHYERRTVPRAS